MTEPQTTERERSAMEDLRDDPTSRKRFFKLAGGGAVATAFAAFAAACGDDDKAGGSAATQPRTTMADQSGDLEIVNYALTLEYLEAEFYEQVIDSGAVTDSKLASMVKEIGENEQAHVAALMATARKLGTPAEKPKTDFTSVLEGGPEKILATAATVENLGAAAYLGQAARIKDKEILAAALSIHSVEGRHAAAINHAAGLGFKGSGPLEGTIPDGAFAKPMTMEQVLEQVQPFLAAG